MPHGVHIGSPHVQSASLDHTIWFHRPFRADEWLLYDQVSPSACGARGLALGRVFTEDGRLVATVAQEGLIRPRLTPANDSGVISTPRPKSVTDTPNRVTVGRVLGFTGSL